MNLDIALRMTEAALRQASREGAAICVAVVDAGGHLVSFQRMAGAGVAGAVLAPRKAYTSVALRAATAGLAPLLAPGGELHGLNDDRFVFSAGGLPLWADDGEGERVAGAVGVSGGARAQDEACAEAAALVWRTR
ncbi:GlcG/HbpS family heme-binding protein [Nonomuraea pusilla]|uniref:Uncharacterized conserved protein GlcG, DUF336 family n=1 Tax=Nonomuraea pusilla TaxID=46177 RepID=A0A1H7KHB2_9ACTN|nr:heme-binding protein [Nonomuraea pusilla]SEK85900.1 Uncharacterized conserved protein GlcG, DUF336 family [Nonomuraea pusilla]